MEDNTSVDIGRDSRACLDIQTNSNGSIKIGKGILSSNNLLLCAGDEASLVIGEDCLFSYNVAIWALDAHSITDKKTGEILNRPVHPLKIGDHCWIGYNAILTKNASIPDDTIVGSGSVVTQKFTEPHTAIAGNPARVVKTGITWDRRTISELEKSRRNAG
jgi:acetyltransferase-like isoleucine patch superfamily enzyme